MYQRFVRPSAFFFLFIICSTAALAQRAGQENSPYSKYALGETQYGTNTILRGMGYASTAFATEYAVNADNPASYSALKGTTYELGLMGSTKTIHTTATKYQTGTGSLTYLNIGVPFKTKWNNVLVLGLKPQSRVFYQNVDTASNPLIGKVSEEYTGEGSLSYAFAGTAASYKGLSLGVNVGYMFGTIKNSSSLVNIDTLNILSTEYSRFTKIGGIYWKAGAQYTTKVAKNTNLRLGATLGIKQVLKAEREEYSLAERIKTGTISTTDTTYYVSGWRGNIYMPLTYSFGAQIFNEKWSIVTDYTATNWSQYSNYGSSDSLAKSSMRVAAGVSYTPDPKSVFSYASRVTYRLGGYYGKDHVQLRGNQINFYAVTLGASLPFKRDRENRISFAAEYGQRGTNINNLIRENYFKFTLGITLTAPSNSRDAWFRKRKYD